MCVALARHGVDHAIIRWIRAPWRDGWPRRLLGDFPPLLWCLVVNELLARFNEGGVYSQGYADDICLLAVGKFPNMVSGFIQRALHTVKLWCYELGLSVNPGKTGLVAFTRKRKLPGFFKPYLFWMTLHRFTSVKYLGVILDSRLIWKEHMDVKVRKLKTQCEPAGGCVVGPGTSDPGWFIGSTSLSSGHPSPLHHCYGGLVVRQPVPRGN